ncbi:MAG: SAM-dependent methyltransferase [Flavobacteriaceae bacterium]|nr:MAG: SAM-dependent methyltransferase [Flavobacteriaceae bacterium]
MKNNFTQTFWDAKYQSSHLGWDLGEISPPLKAYIDQLEDKNADILVPGAGNGYEVAYLHQQGFKNVTVVEISKQPLLNLQQRIPDFPKEHLVLLDFFEHDGCYDLIFEQTFFCALTPLLRESYVMQMHSLLKPSGKIVGLFFDFPLEVDGPPFGGSLQEYQQLFSRKFNIRTLERAYNSIKERSNIELFSIFEKK